jgi:hypothetical protein
MTEQWTSGKAYYRLDNYDDGSGDLYAVFPDGHEELIGALNPAQVREFRETAASARIRTEGN